MATRQNALRGAKQGYVRLAKVAAKATGSGDQIPSRDHRLRHWMVSLPRVHDSLAIAELDVPWWTYRSIDVVDAWLQGRSEPVSVYEYGSGASTMWLASRAARVESVEHHAGFAEMMRQALPQEHVTVRTVEPTQSASPRIASGKEGHDGLDFYDYVHSIEDADGPFDVIVIDGRAREACLQVAADHLAPEGIIIFDNSLRRRYRSTIEQFAGNERRLRGLTPTLPYPEQTSILSR